MVNDPTMMLSIVKNYGIEYNVKFNASKSQLIVYGDNTNPKVYFDGTVLKCEDTASHLGNILGECANELMIEKAISVFVTNFNYIMATFGYCDYEVKYNLFKTYCMPLYGCILWDMTGKDIQKFYVTWRKCLRKLLGLNYRTHSLYIHRIVEDIPVGTQLHKRFMKFIYNALHCENKCVKMCVTLALNGSQSVTCHNMNFIIHQYNLNSIHELKSCSEIFQHISDYVKMQENNVNLHDKVAVSNIKDLLNLRQNPCKTLNHEEISFMLDFFCVKT